MVPVEIPEAIFLLLLFLVGVCVENKATYLVGLERQRRRKENLLKAIYNTIPVSGERPPSASAADL